MFSIAPKQQRHGSTPKLESYEKEVRQLVSEHPDVTLAEFCEMLSEHVSVSDTTLCDFLRHLKITRKKTLFAAEWHQGDVVSRRAEWVKLFAFLDPKRLVFIDETWAKMNKTPLYGWAEIGKRVINQVPHGHWKTTTFVAVLRHDGLTAPMVVDADLDDRLHHINGWYRQSAKS